MVHQTAFTPSMHHTIHQSILYQISRTIFL